jgi:hypothetical protein
MMKNEATLKNVKGLIQKTSDKKKRQPQKRKGLIQKTSNKKSGNPKKCK